MSELPREPLPIDARLPELVAAVRDRGVAVVTAETGAGKTTRVAPALLEAGLAGERRAILLEPRRLAARAAARRIAEERGVALGEEVGYHVRFDRRASARTRLLVVTEGILTRMVQDDPFLDEFGLVLFDEFHERSLAADLAFALVDKVRREARSDLRLVVMSATLDAAPLSRFLGDAPVVAVPGRLHPVAVEWRPLKRDDRLDEAVVAAVRDALRGGADGIGAQGDVLVFLPGLGEIRRCGEALAAAHAGSLAAGSLELVELHGDLAPERQDAALRPGAARRILLATNVAETSVTLPGVTTVIDSGQVRRLQYDPTVGLDRLELGRVSQASAEQRRGRAGRVAPGRCLRLWSALDHRGLAPHEVPEIARVDLSGLVLELLAFGERRPAEFPFLEPPPAVALARAAFLLEQLGATRGGALTAVGRRMAGIPAPPRLARLLLAGEELGVGERAARAAALLSERDPFLRDARGPRREAVHESDSDVVDRVAALEEFATRGTTRFEWGELHRGRADWILRSARQLAQSVRRDARDGSLDADAALRRALFVGWADRLARRREPGSPRALLVGGRGVRLHESSAVRRAELFVAVDLDGGGDEAQVRLASAVEREWLDSSALVTADEVQFDRTRAALVARRITRFADLAIEERLLPVESGEASGAVLAAAVGDDLERALGLAREEVAGLLARVRRLAEWMPELGLPALDAAWWRAWLPELCAGARSFADLQRLPLAELLRARLGVPLARALDQHAPERLVVPSGSAMRLDYPAEGPPVLAARLQELFGWAQTPRIAGGRVAVLLHLLAPNHRPEQVTQDLASFWNTVYPRIRGELRARYPRHSWPDDPWTAVAVRGPKKRR
ncbi:MAG: ATP-dependent helicase HrpB [Planctomycetes bacterium]|nr:ATP-dependent helicase HrpB [Planctomycetota bacterium]